MAATHGSIGAFDSSEEEWDRETYVERVEIYLAANKITDAQQKRDVPLSVCGPKTYHILRDLLAPTKPSDTSYADIVKCLKTHCRGWRSTGTSSTPECGNGENR